MTNPFCSEFKRKFSLSLYKSLKIKLGEMTFSKDFVNDTRGDLYPVVTKSVDCQERVEGNCYYVTGGSVKRLFCQFFPFASYELVGDFSGGQAGFCFNLAGNEAEIWVTSDKLVYSCGQICQALDLPRLAFPDRQLIISCRPGAFDVYFRRNGKPEFFHTFYEPAFQDSNNYALFSNGYAYLSASENVIVRQATSYIDNGVSIADIRPIKYENGDVMLERGKAYFSASIRMQEGTFQGVFSWIPGTAELQMTGALFYDSGDGKWRGYVAPVIIFDRDQSQWLVWVSSFEHEHVLARASFDGDPRFGVNVVDVTLMEKTANPADITLFAGFVGDEDPDLIYDKQNDRWLLAVCRIDPKTRKYVYVFFQSKHPFDGFTYVGKGFDGEETGGSFVKANGQTYFVCGNSFRATSEYRVYSKNGMQTARFNYPDGGFRGWGSVFPVKTASRTRYFWLTFDRHNGSNYNWSYGNLYCFEADLNFDPAMRP